MFLALTTFGSCAVGRDIHQTFEEAKSFALENVQQKVHVSNGKAFFGDFKVLVYDLMPVSSTHVEVPVFVAR
jgi:hypothetical protein